jgi:hypothetical protein
MAQEGWSRKKSTPGLGIFIDAETNRFFMKE